VFVIVVAAGDSMKKCENNNKESELQ